MSNNNNGLWLQLVGTGVAADRPNIPTPPPGVGCFWIATDTGDISVWNGSAWTTIGSTSGVVRIKTYTFAQLPAAPVEGQAAFVSDSNVSTIGDTVAGGGADKVFAIYDGANWIVGGVPAQV